MKAKRKNVIKTKSKKALAFFIAQFVFHVLSIILEETGYSAEIILIIEFILAIL